MAAFVAFDGVAFDVVVPVDMLAVHSFDDTPAVEMPVVEMPVVDMPAVDSRAHLVWAVVPWMTQRCYSCRLAVVLRRVFLLWLQGRSWFGSHLLCFVDLEKKKAILTLGNWF